MGSPKNYKSIDIQSINLGLFDRALACSGSAVSMRRRKEREKRAPVNNV
jgi:hypothetical protein